MNIRTLNRDNVFRLMSIGFISVLCCVSGCDRPNTGGVKYTQTPEEKVTLDCLERVAMQDNADTLTERISRRIASGQSAVGLVMLRRRHEEECCLREVACITAEEPTRSVLIMECLNSKAKTE
jgi:hypothetical protein